MKINLACLFRIKVRAFVENVFITVLFKSGQTLEPIHSEKGRNIGKARLLN